MRLNASKTKAMVVSRKRQPPLLHITISGQPVEVVRSTVHLGFTISSDLTWASHITQVCTRARRMIGFISRSFRDSVTDYLSRLYSSLVLPVLDYGSAVWDLHQAKYTMLLERVQRFAA